MIPVMEKLVQFMHLVAESRGFRECLSTVLNVHSIDGDEFELLRSFR
jgi:hypothetical protein